MFPRLMICIYGGRHTVYIALPLYTCLIYCQQLFLTTPIVAFPPEHTCCYDMPKGVNHHYTTTTAQHQLHHDMHLYQ